MKKKKNIFITWHYTTHGIAYLKHILSAYFKFGPKKIYSEKEISQEEMNIVFDNKNEGFVFDKVYYLTASQKAFDKLSLRRIDYVENILSKDDFIKNDNDLKKVWTKVIEKRRKCYYNKKDFPGLNDEITYVKKEFTLKEYEKWQKSLWRDIHHYKVKDQIEWFGKYSNAKELYETGERLINKPIDIKDFRNTLEISKKIVPFIEDLKRSCSKFPQ